MNKRKLAYLVEIKSNGHFGNVPCGHVKATSYENARIEAKKHNLGGLNDRHYLYLEVTRAWEYDDLPVKEFPIHANYS